MEDGGVCVETNHVKGQEEQSAAAFPLADDEPVAVKKVEENEASPSAMVDVDNEKPVVENDSENEPPHQQQVDCKDDANMVQAESSSPLATEEPMDNGVDSVKEDEKVKEEEEGVKEKEEKKEEIEEVIQPAAVLPKEEEEVKEKPEEKPSVQEEAKENGVSEQIVSKADDESVVLVADLSKSVPNDVDQKEAEQEEEEDDLVMEQEPVELIEEHPESPATKAQQQQQREDEEPAEEQPSSTCSSPSALHIHLDEEDKDDPPMNVSVASVKDKRVDPSMPLISNVVSLSSVASSPNGPSPTPSAGSNGGGGGSVGGSNNTRRTTLRFKRGIEISFDVDQNGQPVTVNNHQSGASGSSTAGTSGEPNQKRGRLDHNEDDEEDQHQVSEMDADTTNVVLIGVQKDIRTLRFMAKQKEKEWNYILKLMKAKEELQAKLMRRREVLKISTGSGRKNHLPSIVQQQTVATASTASSQQQQSSSQHHKQQQQQQLQTQANLQSFINQSLNNLMAASKSALSGAPNSQSSSTSSAAMNLLQQQQQLQQQQLQQQLQQQQSKMNQRQRPILPKPDIQLWNQQQQQQQHHHHHHHHSHSSSLADSGFGSSQETLDARNRTISVQSLIADHRSKHPEEIPTRGRRIRQPSRICNDPNSSNSPPPNSQSSGLEPNANMSFKDVLLQFAKMSSRQGHSASELLGQLSSKELNSSISGSSGMTGNSSNSSAAALQNLAAARNARTASPHATALTAGSILQNALNGSRTNPSFAPTLAQLLTNPANEHQQQQQHAVNQVMAHHQPTVTIPTSATAATSSSAGSAEVLTLSNLLATAKGHVTITSDRDNDDVTVVGGSSSSSSSGRNVNNNGNYMRTSGGGEVPKCQGCNERTAQFVCAGCSSQWYCSRECQVAAWEEHSEHCVG